MNRLNSEMNNANVYHLEFLSETEWGRTHLKEFLYNPNITLWRLLSADKFSEVFKALKLHLRSDDQLIKLLELQILTEALLQKEYTPEWFITWVPENIDVDDYVGPIEWQACLQGKWHAVPVFLVHERAYLRYFILGLVYVPDGPSLWPEWTDQLMDESTKKGIASAVKACKDIHPLNANRKFT